MPSIILYFLKVSVSLAIVWVFYQLLLRRLTFYTMNRWYLLGYSLLAFFIPLIDLGPVLSKGDGHGYVVVVRYIPSIGRSVVLPAVEESGDHWWSVLIAAVILVSVFLLVKLGIQWSSLLMVRRRARLMKDGAVKLYWMDGDVRPFSFGSSVYINPKLHTEKEFSEIILHEYVHIRQRHSFDILFTELLSAVCWYNPFVWLIRYCIRQNLEFIADQAVLNSGVDRKGYQYHLLKVVGEPAYRLANNFNFSSLKKRIVMMNKIRSARLHLVKFLFIVPLIGVSLVAFRNKADGLWKDEGKAIGGVLAGEQGAGKEVRVSEPFAGPSVKKERSLAKEQDAVQTAAMPSREPIRVSYAAAGEQRQDTTKPLSMSGALYVVDGEVRSEKYAKDSLKPQDIYAMDVLKGEHAIKYYGVKASNGAIVVTTKAFKEKYMPVTGGQVTVTGQASGQVPNRPVTIVGIGRTPLYIIDGVEKDQKEMNTLDPNTIESINVLKDAGAVEKYGEKGRNGVIIINLKKKSAADGKPSAGGNGSSGGGASSVGGGVSSGGNNQSTGGGGVSVSGGGASVSGGGVSN
ncbi:MAG: TonB-dependent receptor plug domain-containing protein [Bacteroidetes bacterium]|nr:TonB-dependent receptor plug domain-containing protein [Bacteroidota bacterium]